jgi:hypothetical protein
MSKTNTLNLLLLVIVIGLAFIIYNSEQPDNQLQRLTTIDANTVEDIHIQHNTNSTRLSRLNQDRWSIIEPVIIEANNFRLSSLLKLINAPVHSQYSTDEIDLSAVGLNNSSTRIHFDDTEIIFGVINPATNLRYVMMGGSVFTIEDVFYPLISSHFGTLVSFDLLPDASVIEKLVLPKQTLERDEKGLWRSTIDSDSDSIVKTVQHWKDDQAFGVHEYLQRKDLGKISVYLKDRTEPVTFLITDTDPWLILTRPELGIEYHLDIKSYERLIEPR